MCPCNAWHSTAQHPGKRDLYCPMPPLPHCLSLFYSRPMGEIEWGSLGRGWRWRGEHDKQAVVSESRRTQMSKPWIWGRPCTPPLSPNFPFFHSPSPLTLVSPLLYPFVPRSLLLLEFVLQDSLSWICPISTSSHLDLIITLSVQ